MQIVYQLYFAFSKSAMMIFFRMDLTDPSRTVLLRVQQKVWTSKNQSLPGHGSLPSEKMTDLRTRVAAIQAAKPLTGDFKYACQYFTLHAFKVFIEGFVWIVINANYFRIRKDGAVVIHSFFSPIFKPKVGDYFCQSRKSRQPMYKQNQPFERR